MLRGGAHSIERHASVLLDLVLSCAKTYRPRASFQSDLLCDSVPSTSSFIFLPSSLAPEHRDSRNAMQCDSTHLLRTLRFLGSLLTFSLLSYQPTIFSLSLFPFPARICIPFLLKCVATFFVGRLCSC